MLLYCCEGWTVRKTMEALLQTAEMWFLHQMLKISWSDKTSNDNMLLRANTSRRLTIITRQLRFVEHVVRKGKLEYLTLTGQIEGRRAQRRHSRQRLTFFSWLEPTGIKPLDLIAKTQRRQENAVVTAINARTLAQHLLLFYIATRGSCNLQCKMAAPAHYVPRMQLVLAVCGPKFTKFWENIGDLRS